MLYFSSVSSISYCCFFCYLFFFFNDPATTEIYTLSLHDALPICIFSFHKISSNGAAKGISVTGLTGAGSFTVTGTGDRKSTRLNSSHTVISYAVFCLKKKKIKKTKYYKHNNNKQTKDNKNIKREI